MRVYEKRTHEHFGIIRNLFHGGVVEMATLRSLRWLGSLAWGLRWRVVGPWCIRGAALPWRWTILGDVARATTIVARTPCGAAWVVPKGIGRPWRLTLGWSRMTYDPHRARWLRTRRTRWGRLRPHMWARGATTRRVRSGMLVLGLKSLHLVLGADSNVHQVIEVINLVVESLSCSSSERPS
jgi:hypothetical protein